MSSWYKVQVQVIGVDLKKQDKIIDAANSAWDFTDVTEADEHVGSLYMTGKGSSGELEERLRAIVQAIWDANGAYIEVDVSSLYLDDLPWETHVFDEDTYKEGK